MEQEQNGNGIFGTMFAVVVSAGIWWLLVTGLTGCSSTSGWKVSFGVSPVASINETQVTADKRK